MGFRCSILGCEYAEQRHEREREQRGEEVVLTVREYEECRHCGDKRLISENTGVTTAPERRTVEGDDDHDDRPDDPAGFYEEFDDEGEGSDPATPSEDDAVLPDDAESEPLDVDPDGVADADDAAEDPDDDLPEDEGVEFIDAGPSADVADRATAADADAGETAADAEALVPDADGADEIEADAESLDVDGEDAVLLADDAAEDGAQADARTATDAAPEAAAATDTSQATAPDAAEADDAFVGTDDAREVETDFGEWPDAAPEDPPEHDHGDWPAHPDEDDTGEAFAGVTSVSGADAGAGTAAATADAASAASVGGDAAEEGHDAAVEHGPGARTTRTDVAGELYCRSCEYSDPPSGTPHRSGDICPDCGIGYLTER